ncbi:hypothetical protein Tco_0979201 [Tanacetum coccineum]
MESSNSKERELQMTHRLVKQRHSHCMTWFEQLETHLRDLYLNNSSHVVDAFKPAFRTFFGEEHHTFRLKMFHNLDQLRLQLERENLHKVNAKTYFKEYTLCEPDTYRYDLLKNLDTLEAVIHRAVITYGILRMKENKVNALKVNGKQLNEEILHEHEIKKIFKLQSQDVQINPVQAVDDSFIVSKSSWIESENNNALSKSVNETQLQQHESLVTKSTTLEANLNTDVKALDVGSVITESSGIKSDKRDTSSSSGNYITHAVDADFRPVNDQVPFAEVDSNNTPNLTNISHRGGEIDHDAKQYQVKSPLLNVELSKIKEMIEKEMYNELSHRFLLLEKHCISLELEIQQKDASFQSNKPGKNQDAPEFCEFFEINDLKAQLQAKTTLICNLKNQIKSMKEASNEAKDKNDIDVIETINIKLEHSEAKLLAANEQLHKENEHLKQTYKELYDSIKKTRIQNKDNSDSLISQINQKSVENADLKAQIQETVFANATLKNELRKLKGNRVDTKFVKASILGRLSQYDLEFQNQESAPAKPHHVNAPSSSRNCQKESYGSNDIAHNHFLEEARKKTQDINWNLKPREMPSARTHHTPNACTPKPRSNNQMFRNCHASKSSNVKLNVVQKADHSRNPSSCSNSKHLVCSTCQKCVFNANHDDCITKFLKEVNSRAKVQSPKTRNNNKPVEPKSHTQKPGRQIAIGQRFSLNKSSAVHEKPNTPRSCLRWKPTGRIFKTAGLRWIPTGKMFTDSTTKVDSEPPNGSNDDITNPYECDQTLNVSAGTLNLSAGTSFNPKKERLRVWLLKRLISQKPGVQGIQISTWSLNVYEMVKLTPGYISSGLVQNPVSPTPYVPPSKKDYEILFQLLFDEYFNPPPHAFFLDPVAVAAPKAVDPADSPSSTTIDQDVPLLVLH